MASLAIAEIHDDEAAGVGVYPGTLDWGERIAPLLREKGFPAEALFVGNTKIRTFRLEERKITQFELFGD